MMSNNQQKKYKMINKIILIKIRIQQKLNNNKVQIKIKIIKIQIEIHLCQDQKKIILMEFITKKNTKMKDNFQLKNQQNKLIKKSQIKPNKQIVPLKKVQQNHNLQKQNQIFSVEYKVFYLILKKILKIYFKIKKNQKKNRWIFNQIQYKMIKMMKIIKMENKILKKILNYQVKNQIQDHQYNKKYKKLMKTRNNRNKMKKKLNLNQNQKNQIPIPILKFKNLDKIIIKKKLIQNKIINQMIMQVFLVEKNFKKIKKHKKKQKIKSWKWTQCQEFSMQKIIQTINSFQSLKKNQEFEQLFNIIQYSKIIMLKLFLNIYNIKELLNQNKYNNVIFFQRNIHNIHQTQLLFLIHVLNFKIIIIFLHRNIQLQNEVIQSLMIQIYLLYFQVIYGRPQILILLCFLNFHLGSKDPQEKQLGHLRYIFLKLCQRNFLQKLLLDFQYQQLPIPHIYLYIFPTYFQQHFQYNHNQLFSQVQFLFLLTTLVILKFHYLNLKFYYYYFCLIIFQLIILKILLNFFPFFLYQISSHILFLFKIQNPNILFLCILCCPQVFHQHLINIFLFIFHYHFLWYFLYFLPFQNLICKL